MALKFYDILKDIKLQYKPFGECSILIEWPPIISDDILKSVLNYKKNIEKNKIKQKVYVISAYNSLLVCYNIAINNFYYEIKLLKSLYYENTCLKILKGKLWKIPVCYDIEFGIDLKQLSIEKNMLISEILSYHTMSNYRVYFLGFLPGFLYLGGLHHNLHFPRKSTPKLRVKKGSVAIGASQTGIYPNDSPGGWHIIGETPLNLFNIHNKLPCFAKPGDKIKFISITKNEFVIIQEQIRMNTYRLESEIIYD